MKLACRLFGHQYYWLDMEHQRHCRRCGKRDDAYFERQADLEQILFAAPTSYRNQVVCEAADGHDLSRCDDTQCPVCIAGLTPRCPECGASV